MCVCIRKKGGEEGGGGGGGLGHSGPRRSKTKTDKLHRSLKDTGYFTSVTVLRHLLLRGECCRAFKSSHRGRDERRRDTAWLRKTDVAVNSSINHTTTIYLSSTLHLDVKINTLMQSYARTDVIAHVLVCARMRIHVHSPVHGHAGVFVHKKVHITRTNANTLARTN